MFFLGFRGGGVSTFEPFPKNTLLCVYIYILGFVQCVEIHYVWFEQFAANMFGGRAIEEQRKTKIKTQCS